MKSVGVPASVPLPGVMRGLSDYTKLCLSPPRLAAAKNGNECAFSNLVLRSMTREMFNTLLSVSARICMVVLLYCTTIVLGDIPNSL